MNKMHAAADATQSLVVADILSAASRLMAAGDEQTVLAELVRSLVGSLGCHVAYVYRVEIDGRLTMVAQAGMHLAPEELAAFSLPPGAGINGEVARLGQVRQIRDLRQGAALSLPDLPEREHLVGLLSAPVLADDQVLGVLTCHTNQPHDFSPEEVAALSAMAQVAAVALARADELRSIHQLHMIGQELFQPLSLDEVLRVIARHARLLGRAEGAVIYLYDHEREVFELERVVGDGIGQSERLARNRQPRRNSMSARVLEAGWAEVPDIAHLPDQELISTTTQAELLGLGVKACTGWALWQDVESVGVLYLNYSHPHPRLRASDRRHFQLFVQQAALAIQRARLFAHAEQRRELIMVTARVTRQVSSVQQTWDTVLGEAMRLTAAAAGNISVVTPDGQHLQHVATHGFPPHFTPARLEIGGQSIQGQVALTMRPARVGDVRADEQWARHYHKSNPATVSELVVPLHVADDLTGARKILGIINLESPVPYAFSQAHQELLEDLCIHGKIAVMVAEESENLRREKERFEALADASRAVTSSLDEGPTQRAILATAAGLTRAHFATLQVVEDGALVFYEVYPTHDKVGLTHRVGDRMPLAGPGLTVRAARTGRPVREADVRGVADYVDGTGGRTRSELAVPLVEEAGQVVGVLNVEHEAVAAFSAEDEIALQALARMSLIALRNARRFHELRAAKDRLEHSRRFAFAADLTYRAVHQLTSRLCGMQVLVRRVAAQCGLPEASLLTTAADPRARDLALLLDLVESATDLVERQVRLLVAQDIHPCDLGRAITTALLAARLPAQLTVRQDLPADLQAVEGTEALSDVFRVLFDNALDAMLPGEPGNLEIRATPEVDGHWVRVSVCDDGAGMPPAILEQVRLRLYGTTTKRRRGQRGGMGLGLYWVQDHLDRLNGRVPRFASPPPGADRGVEVTIWLRVAGAPANHELRLPHHGGPHA